jgi:hypothetical protein
MRRITGSEVANFTAAHEFSVIHLDAEWDGYERAVRDKMKACAAASQDVGFAEMNVDEEQQFANAVNIINVPTVFITGGKSLSPQLLGAAKTLHRTLSG